MNFEHPPSLPCAHQQIRLGDIQATAHKWSAAVDYYLRAIELFKDIQKTLHDDCLIGIIEAQIIQCEKMINLCQLKDRLGQVTKIECCPRIARIRSTTITLSPSKTDRILKQRNALLLNRTKLSNETNTMNSPNTSPF